jgi:predicted ribosome quality control (RQC) complex YloA/Tae2 family protein
LFSKGNVILTDSEFEIIAVLERQIWKERTVKPGEKYIFPGFVFMEDYDPTNPESVEKYNGGSQKVES